MNHKIILSDHGEFVKDVDLNRTANKSLVDKLCHSSGLRWNGKQLYMESSLEMLDEDIWNMFSCMVTIQNVCY
jgi:hypothetical protein